MDMRETNTSRRKSSWELAYRESFDDPSSVQCKAQDSRQEVE